MMHTQTNVYWNLVQCDGLNLCLAATDKGLCCITLPNENLGVLENWILQHVPNALMIQDEARVYPFQIQLEEYFQGLRKTFSLPLDFYGTAFQVSVWRALMDIPYGTTRNYSDVAIAIKRPSCARAVGAANSMNPLPIVVPCHRVIGKDGALTGYRGGLALKRRLLDLEGDHAGVASLYM